MTTDLCAQPRFAPGYSLCTPTMNPFVELRWPIARSAHELRDYLRSRRAAADVLSLPPPRLLKSMRSTASVPSRSSTPRLLYAHRDVPQPLLISPQAQKIRIASDDARDAAYALSRLGAGPVGSNLYWLNQYNQLQMREDL